jgi:hypothetical protein
MLKIAAGTACVSDTILKGNRWSTIFLLHEVRSEYAQIMTVIFLLINGPGRWPLDALLQREKKRVNVSEPVRAGSLVLPTYLACAKGCQRMGSSVIGLGWAGDEWLSAPALDPISSAPSALK